MRRLSTLQIALRAFGPVIAALAILLVYCLLSYLN